MGRSATSFLISFSLLAAISASLGCGGEASPGEPSSDDAGVGGDDGLDGELTDGGSGDGGTSTGDTGGASTGDTGGVSPTDTGTSPPIDPTTAAAVCARWKADRAALSEGAFSGSAATCSVGDIAEPTRANTLRQINLYRWLAKLPAVTNEASRDKAAQACSLMMLANGSLSHSPPTSWKCYSAEGAGSAGKSNISSTTAVQSVGLYMLDPGNATTMGHRRWILSNSLGPVGIGGTSGPSCLQVIGGSGKAAKEYLPWPSAGIFPIEAMGSGGGVDSTGWTVQSDSIDFKSATATVTESGVDKPVDVVKLAGGYGSAQAIKITPKGWKSVAGKTYAVSVKGASKPIDYTVEMVSCP